MKRFSLFLTVNVLTLLVFASALLLGMIPITPGGLGFVEAGLYGTLTLAGVATGQAVLATLMYRLASYWLPILAGPVAYLLFRSRYGPRRKAGGLAGSTPGSAA